MFARTMVRGKIAMLGLAAGQALTVCAMAQSVNIDIDRNTGSGAGVPSSGYGAAAGQPGTWNSVPTADSAALPLAGLNGAASGLSITSDLAGGASSTSGSSSSDFGKLMWDYADQCCFYQSTQNLSISGLNAGNYWLYVYAALPGAAGNFNTLSGVEYYGTVISAYFDENPDIFLGGGYTSGIVTPDSFVSGVHFYRLPITVDPGQAPLFLSIGGQYTDGDFNVKSAINGLQLKQFTTNRLYVDINATGVQTGENWANAMNSLAEALNVAATWSIDEIWVANGTYMPPGNRTQSFNIPSGTKVYGGFSGNENSLAHRNWSVNQTILSGNIGNYFSSADDSYHVVNASNTNSSTLVDGFIITSGNANSAANDADRSGGGIYGQDCDAEFRNCTIRYNAAEFRGAGAYLSGDSDADFVNCTFFNNDSGLLGGGLAISGDTSIIDIVNARFTSNSAGDRGGGVYHEGQRVRIVNSLFNTNTATSLGGGLYAYGFTNAGEFEVTNSTFYNNHANLSGGLRAFSAEGFVRNSIFHLNTDDDASTSLEVSNITSTSGSVTEISHSWVTGLQTYAGNGNVGGGGLPGFVDANGTDNTSGTLDDDFRLDQGYPTVDSGNDTFRPADFYDIDNDGVAAESLPVDLNGNPRRVDDRRSPNATGGWRIDMGAYERRECFFDYNGDGFVDDFDFVLFSQAYADFASEQGDYNGDGFTDDTDFVFFTQQYEQFTCE